MKKKKNDFIVIYDEHDPDNPERVNHANNQFAVKRIVLSLFLLMGTVTGGILLRVALEPPPAPLPTVISLSSPLPPPTLDPDFFTTKVRSTLPPEWTPSPVVTEVFAPEGMPTALTNVQAAASLTGQNMLAYVGSAFHTGGYSDDIFLLDLDTRVSTNLTNDQTGNGFPTWSPDGLQIIYQTGKDYTRPVNRQLFVVNADGRSSRQLTFNARQRFDFPSWLPDGKHILVTSISQMQDDPDLLIMNVGTGEMSWIVDDSLVQEAAAWSPDGTRVVYSNYDSGSATHNLYVMNTDGSGLHNISNRLGADDNFPMWSPDGQWIAFVSSRDEAGNRDIYLMDADGNNIRRLTTTPTLDEYPSWSPDGSQIVYSADNVLALVSVYSGASVSLEVIGTQPAWRPRPDLAQAVPPTS